MQMRNFMNGNLIINIIYLCVFRNNNYYYCMNFGEIGIELIDGYTIISNNDKNEKNKIE